MISANQLAQDDPVTHLLLRQEGHGLYRVQCMSCAEEFDLFGQLIPGEHPPDSMQRACIEHVERCQGYRRAKTCVVQRNNNTPTLFLVRIEWTKQP